MVEDYLRGADGASSGFDENDSREPGTEGAIAALSGPVSTPAAGVEVVAFGSDS